MGLAHIDWQTADYMAAALLGFVCWTIMIYVMGYRKGAADAEWCEEKILEETDK